MKKGLHIFLLVLAGFLLTSGVQAKTASEVFDAVSHGVVVIRTYDVKGDRQRLGSGVVLADGAIATNFHVIKNATTIKVMYQKTEFPATLRHSDLERDVCTLVVNGLNAPSAVIGATDRLKVGERVYAIGAPQGLELTLSEGIISSLRSVDGGQYIQITAPISPGSSGGGLFDEEGRLIGLTTFYLTESQQLNFAVPVEWISELPKRHKESLKSYLVPDTDWINKSIALQLKQNWVKLIEHSLRWTKEQPKNAVAWASLGTALGKSGQTSKAIEAYQQALRISPEYAEAWNNLGIALGLSGQASKEIEAYQQALRINPEYADGWYLLGVAYRMDNQTGQVMDVYKHLKVLDPTLADKFFNEIVLP